ncbi:MAG: glutamine-hydrolyzing GMP synthase [Propionibacteriaceae bacterium]|nr:glutamine-hydrolyzing GMP synthase [Propionibacteriaceae bacterium]
MDLARELVLVVDYGAQYAQLIARRVREAKVYSHIIPHSATIAEIMELKPSALILSGGPASVYEPGAPQVDPALFDLGIPVFGICYGFQAMALALGGQVDRTDLREYGRTQLTIHTPGDLLSEVPPEFMVWMSHGVSVHEPPPGFLSLASTQGAEVAAMEDTSRKLAGVQWHPEVLHSQYGQQVLDHFLHNIAGLGHEWDSSTIVEDSVQAIRNQVGDEPVLCGLSGGVDSAVAAALVQKAIGENLTCVFVDHGLLRKGEAEAVEKDFVAATGARLVVADAREQFLSVLRGVTDPEQKRKAIGHQFIRTFEAEAARLAGEQGIRFLVQGTLYPDVVESGGGTGTANIKSHHNVGGLPEDLSFELVEPLRTLFKDEVRAVGEELGLPTEMVWRHPFPGPGLGIRIIGEVTEERLAILREADAIAREELTSSGLDREIWQFPVVLLGDVRSVGVQGDERTYGHPIVLRPVTSEDAMTADWGRLPYEVLEKISTRITNEVPHINRVTLDITSKPPGTIEWE